MRLRSVVFFAATFLSPLSALAQSTPVDPPPAPAAPVPPASAPLLPSAEPPTSTSGSDVGTSGPSTPVSAPAAPTSDAGDARLHALEQRIEKDEKRIRELESADRFKHLRFESFIQPQLLVQSYDAAASPNVQPNGALPPGIDANDTIAKPDGTTTNGTFFRVRRARLRAFYETDVARLFLQLDALPAGGVGPGIGTILRNAEATGILRWSRQVRTEFTAGLFFTPFRAELLEPSLVRPFIERTWFVLNAFPTERDYGIHAKTIALGDKLVVDLAVINGQRLGERTFVALPDLNRSKDFIAYATYTLGPVTVGASGYVGRGQLVDPQALRFKQFDKWAVNAQLSFAQRILRSVGDTRLFSELTFTQNMDSGVNYAFAVPQIPNRLSDDVRNLRGRALVIRFEQDILRWFTVGYRYDMYTPNVSIDNNARDTHAFLAVWKVSPNLRFMNELGAFTDNVHAANTQAPSKDVVYYSGVLQASF